MCIRTKHRELLGWSRRGGDAITIECHRHEGRKVDAVDDIGDDLVLDKLIFYPVDFLLSRYSLRKGERDQGGQDTDRRSHDVPFVRGEKNREGEVLAPGSL